MFDWLIHLNFLKKVFFLNLNKELEYFRKFLKFLNFKKDHLLKWADLPESKADLAQFFKGLNSEWIVIFLSLSPIANNMPKAYQPSENDGQQWRGRTSNGWDGWRSHDGWTTTGWCKARGAADSVVGCRVRFRRKHQTMEKGFWTAGTSGARLN